MTLVQSEDIIVRERYGEDLIRGQQFVLSFAAVIMLYLIGVSRNSKRKTGICSRINEKYDINYVYGHN